MTGTTGTEKVLKSPHIRRKKPTIKEWFAACVVAIPLVILFYTVTTVEWLINPKHRETHKHSMETGTEATTND